jgi:hypothetical protein
MMNPFEGFFGIAWQNAQSLPTKQYFCGYCSKDVGVDRGYPVNMTDINRQQTSGGIYICPVCMGPTLIRPDGWRFPGAAFGGSVSHVPLDLNELYEEARRCASHSCFTAAVLLCRKMLMNIAVSKGAAEGQSFAQYIEYLAAKGYIPPDGKHWVDHIRKKGNEATHQIAVMSEDDAKDLLILTEMLLRFVFEFPAMVATPAVLPAPSITS